MKHINSYEELKSSISGNKKVYILLYKNGSAISDCALKNIEKASAKTSGELFLRSDVSNVKDIHGKFNINSVPSLLLFENGIMTNVIKGCNDESFYDYYFNNHAQPSAGTEKNKQKRVTVYSTPSCSWCTKLKNYFREKNITFRDVDVSKDQRKMDELVRKSGQTGVPQTEIGSEIIVGFDKARINKLLNLK